MQQCFGFLYYTELFGAVVFSFILAVVYEGLKMVKDILIKRSKRYLYAQSQCDGKSPCNDIKIATSIRHR